MKMLPGCSVLTIAILLLRIHQSSAVCPRECTCVSKMLNCSRRNLTHIPFIADSTYEVMDFSFNNISVLGNTSFMKNRFPMLRKIDFSSNTIIEINSNVFVGFGKITELSLANNKLVHLTRDVFESLGNLKELYLQGNNLATIHPQILSSLKLLEALNMSHNNISEIKNGTFTNLTQLRSLTLLGNKLKIFSPEVFNLTRSLTHLDLQLFEMPKESTLYSEKSELTQCLCERKRALDWCEEKNITCMVTCDYSEESKYNGMSNVCHNALPVNDFGKTRFNNFGHNPEVTKSDFIWATVITVGVVLLLIITLTMLIIVVRKTKSQLGEEDYSELNDYETYRGHITPMKDEEFRWSFKNDTGK